MAQKESPIVELAGHLGKIKHLAGAAVLDANKQKQIIRLADKGLGLLTEIEQTQSKVITPEEARNLVHGDEA